MTDTPLYYRPAHQLLADLKAGTLSSVDVTRAFLDRIAEHNDSVNAVVHLDEDAAMKGARTADEQRASGAAPGPLHGLPVTLKDTWEVAEMTCTAGAPALKHHVPRRSADVVERLVAAGAIVVGKTNVPLYASDVQSYNKLFGVTNNPYDNAHTPGGSSGGAAAALAAGMTPLEIGSDLAGSIRTPAHFCGVFGHKPSRGLVSFRGHIPGPPGTMGQPDLAEGGPLARTAQDLELLLGVIAGPTAPDSRCWQLAMEPSGLTELSEARVGLWLDDPRCPINAELSRGYRDLGEKLTQSGAQVAQARHPLLSLDRIMPVYFNLLGSLLSTSFKPGQRRQLLWISRLDKVLRHFVPMTAGVGQYGRGVNQPIHQWIQWHETREKMRAQIETLFEHHDVLLTPVTPTTAIPHDLSQPMFKRRVSVDGKTRSYLDQFCWIALATLLGLPATSVPVGRTAKGLPYNIQVIGAPGKDLTTIRFAQLLEERGLAGFRVPEGF
ncbi:MAG: amidase, partial [Marinobacter sp.]|uniref:amidase n=1 Tax=Marinobacter sp. TaxID=50741 RepID=UPI00299DB325